MVSRFHARLLLTLGLLVHAVNCSGPEPTKPGSVVRDSAGSVVLEFEGPAWSSSEGWTIASEYFLEIGGEDSGKLFERVRQIFWLGQDTRFVVGDNGARTIEIYDTTGIALFSAGGVGAGPGEFESLDFVGKFRGDSILAYDGRLGRATIFDSQLRYVRTVNNGTSLERVFSRPLGVFSDGSVLTWGRLTWSGSETMDRMVGGGRFRPPHELSRVEIDLGKTEILDTLLHVEGFAFDVDGHPNSMTPLFGRVSIAGVFGTGYFTADTEKWEVVFYDSSLNPTTFLRRMGTGQPIESRQVEELKQQRSRRLPANRFGDIARRQLALMPIPGVMPAFGRGFGSGPSLIADGDFMWVLDYHYLEGVPETWSVFEPARRFYGTVEFPGGFTPMSFSDGWVVGVWKDEFDVQHVRVYEVLK